MGSANLISPCFGELHVWVGLSICLLLVLGLGIACCLPGFPFPDRSKDWCNNLERFAVHPSTPHITSALHCLTTFLPSKQQKQTFLSQTKHSPSPGDIALNWEQTLETWSPLYSRKTRGVVLVFLNLGSLTLLWLTGFCWSSRPCPPKLDPMLLLGLRRPLPLECLDLLSGTPRISGLSSSFRDKMRQPGNRGVSSCCFQGLNSWFPPSALKRLRQSFNNFDHTPTCGYFAKFVHGFQSLLTTSKIIC